MKAGVSISSYADSYIGRAYICRFPTRIKAPSAKATHVK